MNGSIFLTSFFSIHRSGSKPLTSAAKRVGYLAASNLVMGPMPDRPSPMAVQNSSTVFPTGVTAPSPVMTTRRSLTAPPPRSDQPLRRVVLDVLDGVSHRRDLLGILVRDLDVERLLERHDQLHGVQGVGAEILDELRRGDHLFFLRPQLFADDFLDFVLNRVCHAQCPPSCIVKLFARSFTYTGRR